ncbi:MAG: phosphomannomutase/phosphoglucomutase [Bacteroidales bacterium]|jgi:phosphomannomutase|nr:phosphoglucomutase [Lentimicrobiaceae bacterium]MDG1135590.1 phosphomannomutase/phosphoglucomutase [Bacteroidales bacterium]MDG1901537.1 phosphomannomutase/phosphoglucomutase [Bacteroidales bacterium]MDG2081404.1 phosphomannomutase/phosphoglucomutase [Bacteroidales bacterium]|tara:strand:- start:11303 stop:12646 length:1344 start_codon:yes stop_codon:yes gene_type:complete
MKAFKAYDIRGVWGRDLNPQIAYKIGNFVPKVFGVNQVLIGRDIRLSSNEIFQQLSNGLMDAGANVIDAGLSTTPMVYWGTGKFNIEFSIMITASHNSSEYNGMKFSGSNVTPIGYDNGLNTLEKLITDSAPQIKSEKGKLEKLDFKDQYFDFLNSYKPNCTNLKIAIDCSNGMSALFTKRLFGENPIYINDKMDGTFPGHDPNPLETDNQKQIKECVTSNKCDIGVIYDGDADRVMFIDEKGKFVSPDLIIALLAKYFFEDRGERGTVVQDIRTSKSVGDYLKKYDTELVIWKVGRAFGATKLKEVNGIYGGELAGHYYFRDFYYSDSGLLASVLVLNIVSKLKLEGVKFSQVMDAISTYANTGEVNFIINEKQEAMDAVLEYFKDNNDNYKFFDFDGYRLEFTNWWFNIRPSNTEPYLRFLAEAESEELLESKTRIIYGILSKYE